MPRYCDILEPNILYIQELILICHIFGSDNDE